MMTAVLGNVVLLVVWLVYRTLGVMCMVVVSPAVPCTVSVALLLGDGPTPLLALQV